MIKNRDTRVSEHVARRVVKLRWERGWTRAELSNQLHDHRCALHPDGFDMSPAVISVLETGVPAQHGYQRRIRSVTADELTVLAEVFRTRPENLLP